MKSKDTICSRCWLKENGKCSQVCKYREVPTKPIEAARFYLENRNDVQIFPFMLKYAIPVYEDMTGRTGTIERLSKLFKRKWKKKHPDALMPS